MTKLTLPTIHRNGTGRPELVKQTMEAFLALDMALEAMAKAAPHGRDYYPQDQGAILGPAFLKAAEEHRRRVAKVFEVRQELEKLAMEIHDR